MDEVGQSIVEVLLAILFLASFFFFYALLDKHLRPLLLPASSSPLESDAGARSSTAAMVAAFAFYVVLPNLTLVGGITLIVVLGDELHFVLKDMLIGAVASALAVVVLVLYGALGVRSEGSHAQRVERRRRMAQDLEQYRTNVYSISSSQELPLPSYDELARRSSDSSTSSVSASSSSAHSRDNDVSGSRSSSSDSEKKLELPPSYVEALEIETKLKIESKEKRKKRYQKQNIARAASLGNGDREPES